MNKRKSFEEVAYKHSRRLSGLCGFFSTNMIRYANFQQVNVLKIKVHVQVKYCACFVFSVATLIFL